MHIDQAMACRMGTHFAKFHPLSLLAYHDHLLGQCIEGIYAKGGVNQGDFFIFFYFTPPSLPRGSKLPAMALICMVRSPVKFQSTISNNKDGVTGAMPKKWSKRGHFGAHSAENG